MEAKIKNWILGWILDSDGIWIDVGKIIEHDAIKRHIYTLLFKQATDDVLETFNEDVEKRAEELATKKLNDLLSNVDLKSIVKLDKTHGIMYIGDERADPARLQNLKQEADALVQFDIWKLLMETPKELAQRQIFVSSESLDDLKKGKSILYTLSVQKNLIDTLRGYTQKK